MLIFPDVEKEVRAYLFPLLGERFPGVKVLTRIPSGLDWTTKPTIVALVVTGSGRRTGRVYEEVLVGFDCFAPTKGEAHRLAQTVRALVEDWPNRSGLVAGFSDNARPSDSTDEETEYPSYWYSANLLFKATSDN